MNKSLIVVALVLLSLPLLSHASCDTTKASIDAKIQANGVSNYTLNVVSADESVTDGKVVGHCEGGQQIVYSRGGGASSDQDATPATPRPESQGAAPAASTSSGG